jgi:hypothetical protein
MTLCRSKGLIELMDNSQLIITPNSAIKAVSSVIDLKSNSQSYSINATLSIEILYHCLLCGAKNMNYETSEFHKQTMEHLITLQKSLECNETATECLDEADMDTDVSVASTSEKMIHDDQPIPVDCDDDQKTETACEDVIVSASKLKRKCSFVEEPEVSDDESVNSKFDKPMTRDGNCLFRSLADQIYGDEMYHLLLRHSCYHYLKDHPDLGYDLGYSESDIATIIEKGFLFGEWAGDIETKIISEIYHFRIETIDKTTKSVIQHFGKLNWATLRVVFSTTENHYDSYIAISNTGTNFSDVFDESHFDAPGSFENDLFPEDCLPHCERMILTSRLVNLHDIYEITPKSLGLFNFTGKYESSIIDTVFANRDMVMKNKETVHFPSDDLQGDKIYYKLQVEDCDVIWCSLNYLTTRKKVFKEQKRSGRKRRRTWKQLL